MAFRLDVGDDAKADIRSVLEWSVFRFGADVRDGYEALIGAALDGIVEDPELPGSHERDDIRRGLLCLHLKSCRDSVAAGARRIANPRHILIYRCIGNVVQVVRLLHEASDIRAEYIPK